MSRRVPGPVARMAAWPYEAAHGPVRRTMPYRRVGRIRAACCPPSRSGCGRTSATSIRSQRQRDDPAPRVRPRRHALRPGQQLRAAVRLRRDQLRPAVRRGLPAVPRRAGHLHQGRVRHVAGSVRRLGLAQVPAGLARRVAAPDGPGLRRHLLLAPRRPGDPARGDDGRAAHRGDLGPGAVRRDLVLLAGAHRAGGRDPRGPRHAAADPPAVVLDAQPLDRGRAAGHPRPAGRRAASRSRRWRRAC